MMTRWGAIIGIVGMMLAGRAEASFLLLGVGTGDNPVASGTGCTPGAGGAYTGPGDVCSGATVYYGLRPYNNIVASTGLSIINACTAADSICGDFTATASGGISEPAVLGSSCNLSGSCTIKEFYDQSGNANHAIQATIANRATLSLSCTSGHSQPCAQFVTANSQSYKSVNTITQVQPFTMVAYVDAVNSGALQRYFGNSNASTFLYLGISATSGQANLIAGSTLTATASNGAYHAFGAVVMNTTSTLEVDGTPTTGTAGVRTFSADNACIGAISTNCTTGYFNSNITELALYPGAFSSANLTAMNANQQAFW